MDKVDGSLVSVYYYSGAWHIASSSVPDGRGYKVQHPSYHPPLTLTLNNKGRCGERVKMIQTEKLSRHYSARFGRR